MLNNSIQAKANNGTHQVVEATNVTLSIENEGMQSMACRAAAAVCIPLGFFFIVTVLCVWLLCEAKGKQSNQSKVVIHHQTE